METAPISRADVKEMIIQKLSPTQDQPEVQDRVWLSKEDQEYEKTWNLCPKPTEPAKTKAGTTDNTLVTRTQV